MKMTKTQKQVLKQIVAGNFAVVLIADYVRVKYPAIIKAVQALESMGYITIDKQHPNDKPLQWTFTALSSGKSAI